MKKVLFATTALVASAGIASAQGIELSGSAEMGIFGGTGVDAQFHTDVDVTFTMSGETDGGLKFGASIDLDESVTGAAFAANTQGGESIFISGSFGTLTMGDTDGALDWATSETPKGPGSINDAHEVGLHQGMQGLDNLNGGQIARYDYSMNGFGIAVSAEDSNTGGDFVLGVGVKYAGTFSGGSYNLGFGYQERGTQNALAVSAGMALDSGLSAGILYAEGDLDRAGANDDTHIGIGVAYSMDQMSFGINYVEEDDNGVKTDGFGLSAGYDLGGGAKVLVGYGSFGGATKVDSWSLGVAMSF